MLQSKYPSFTYTYTYTYTYTCIHMYIHIHTHAYTHARHIHTPYLISIVMSRSFSLTTAYACTHWHNHIIRDTSCTHCTHSLFVSLTSLPSCTPSLSTTLGAHPIVCSVLSRQRQCRNDWDTTHTHTHARAYTSHAHMCHTTPGAHLSRYTSFVSTALSYTWRARLFDTVFYTGAHPISHWACIHLYTQTRVVTHAHFNRNCIAHFVFIVSHVTVSA